MSLVDLILGRTAEQRKVAWREYADLIERDDTSTASIAKLTKVMDVIGRKPEDLPGDRQILMQARILREQIRDGSGLDSAFSKARKAVIEHNTESAKLARERQLRHAALVAESSSLSGRSSIAERSVHQLMAMRNDHPELLSHIPAVKVEDLGTTPPEPAEEPAGRAA